MAGRCSKLPLKAHVVDISFSLGEEKIGVKEPNSSKVGSRRNSISSDSTHLSQDSITYDSLLSFAMKMNPLQVAESLLREQEDIHQLQENSSFLTNVVNKSSLKRGLSEQQMMLKAMEEVERARQRFLRRANTVQTLQSAQMDSERAVTDKSHDSIASDDDDDDFSNDSIGSLVDGDVDLEAGYGVGGDILETDKGGEVGGRGGETLTSSLNDKQEVFDMLSSLLEGDSHSNDSDYSDNDDNGDSAAGEGTGGSSLLYGEALASDLLTPHESNTSMKNLLRGSSSYFELSKSLQGKSPKQSDEHLRQLLANAHTGSPSRLPKVPPGGVATSSANRYEPYESALKPIALTTADPFTSGEKMSFRYILHCVLHFDVTCSKSFFE